MKIAIGNDHAGTEYKYAILDFLKQENIDFENYGTDSQESVDYPDFVHPVAGDVENNKADFGVVICGSGNGVAITANKHKGVRAALCWTKEIASLAREHNDANILCIPARFTSIPQAVEMLKTFLKTDFAGGRHQNRVSKIPCK
ncbi:MAG TPA: ribose 5-phosphate isomerase B [Salinimicrobium sp.]|nr:ribose 5-phosphate isomerase B [Salinimicrobium sp.]